MVQQVGHSFQFLPLHLERLFRLALLLKCQPTEQGWVGGRGSCFFRSFVPLGQKLAIVSNQIWLLGAELHMCQLRLPSVVGTVKGEKLFSPLSHINSFNPRYGLGQKESELLLSPVFYLQNSNDQDELLTHIVWSSADWWIGTSREENMFRNVILALFKLFVLSLK